MDGNNDTDISHLRCSIPLSIADPLPATALINASRDIWMSVILTVSGTISLCWCFYLLVQHPGLLTTWMAAIPGLFILLTNAAIQYRKSSRLVRCPKCYAILDTQPFTIAERLILPKKDDKE